MIFKFFLGGCNVMKALKKTLTLRDLDCILLIVGSV